LVVVLRNASLRLQVNFDGLATTLYSSATKLSRGCPYRWVVADKQFHTPRHVRPDAEHTRLAVTTVMCFQIRSQTHVTQ
jgi:hypothetical protein